jgi:hypothetical protein
MTEPQFVQNFSSMPALVLVAMNAPTFNHSCLEEIWARQSAIYPQKFILPRQARPSINSQCQVSRYFQNTDPVSVALTGLLSIDHATSFSLGWAAGGDR